MPGLYFDEFSVGQTFDHMLHRTISEADNVLITTMTHNPSALHLDAEYMKNTEFGKPLVNSCLTLSLMVGISVNDTTHGTAVANLRLATSETRTNKEGEKETKTEWHRVVAFGRTAEVCGEYLSKGKQIYIEGRIQTRQWEDRDGNKRYTTEIVANTMQMLGRAGEKPEAAPETEAPQSEPQAGEPSPPDMDDIPF